MAASKGLEAAKLTTGDSNGIAAAARIISRAFSEDPLIKWLRPSATPWGNLESGSISWQQRRVQRSLVENHVVVLKEISPLPESAAGFPAVGILCPPQVTWPGYITSLHSRLWLSLLDTVSPVHDEGGNMSRVETMMDNHGKNKKIVESLTNKPAWYIEVVAVDPAYQGRKLGSTMVRSLLELCPPDSAIYLECTDAKNVGFYEKFGFKTVLDIKLKDPTVQSDIGVKLWLMARF